MFCSYTRPSYQVSVYRTIGPLVSHDVAHNIYLYIAFAYGIKTLGTS